MIMDALIYGWMDRASMVACLKDPPDITFISPRMLLLAALK